MDLPFATRAPTEHEVEVIRLLLSTYRDGSGTESDTDSSTRAGWRQMERALAEMLTGEDPPENKSIFDVIARSLDDAPVDFGLSIKSKQLSRKSAIEDLEIHGRVYMEIANSPAKLWEVVKADHNIHEADFIGKRHPNEIGNSVIGTIKKWHVLGKQLHEQANPGRELRLDKSIYLCISYSAPKDDNERMYQIHSFSLDFPGNIKWDYISDKCVRGYDSDNPDEPLFDWYGLSGGQLKYYPKAKHCLYKTPPFRLLRPKRLSISEKAQAYWEGQWEGAYKNLSFKQRKLLRCLPKANGDDVA